MGKSFFCTSCGRDINKAVMMRYDFRIGYFDRAKVPFADRLLLVHQSSGRFPFGSCCAQRVSRATASMVATLRPKSKIEIELEHVDKALHVIKSWNALSPAKRETLGDHPLVVEQAMEIVKKWVKNNQPNLKVTQ